MKYVSVAVCLAAFFSVVASNSFDAGFVPKAIYTLDANGHPSHLQPITPHLLRRLRRQVFTSSSSSSSSYSDGGPTYFNSQQVVHSSNGLAAASPNVQNRFGEASVPVGQVVQTAGVVGADGKLTTLTTHGVIDNTGNVQYSQYHN